MARKVIQWFSVAMGGNQSQAVREAEPHRQVAKSMPQPVQDPCSQPPGLANAPPPQAQLAAPKSMPQPVQDPCSQPPGLANSPPPQVQLAAEVNWRKEPWEGAAAAPPPPGSAWGGYAPPPPPPEEVVDCRSEVRPSPETRMTRMVILILGNLILVLLEN